MNLNPLRLPTLPPPHTQHPPTTHTHHPTLTHVAPNAHPHTCTQPTHHPLDRLPAQREVDTQLAELARRRESCPSKTCPHARAHTRMHACTHAHVHTQTNHTHHTHNAHTTHMHPHLRMQMHTQTTSKQTIMHTQRPCTCEQHPTAHAPIEPPGHRATNLHPPQRIHTYDNSHRHTQTQTLRCTDTRTRHRHTRARTHACTHACALARTHDNKQRH